MIIICKFKQSDMTFLITQYSSHDSRDTYKTWNLDSYLGFCACYQILKFCNFIINAQTITFFNCIMGSSLFSFLRPFVRVVQAIDRDFFTVHHLNWNSCYDSLHLRKGGSD